MFKKVFVTLVCVAVLSACAIPLKGYEGKPIAHVAPKGCPPIKSAYGSLKGISGGSRQNVHKGIDILDGTGSPVIAAAPGVIALTGNSNTGGNLVYLYHGVDKFENHVVSSVWHLSAILVKTGQVIKRGEKIALIGKTGTNSGGIPHLHFQAAVHAEGKGFEEGLPGSLSNAFSKNLHHFAYDPQNPEFTAFDPSRDYGDKEGVFTGFTYPVPCGG